MLDEPGELGELGELSELGELDELPYPFAIIYLFIYLLLSVISELTA